MRLLRIAKVRIGKAWKKLTCKFKGHAWSPAHYTGFKNEKGKMIKVKYCKRCPIHEEITK